MREAWHSGTTMREAYLKYARDVWSASTSLLLNASFALLSTTSW